MSKAGDPQSGGAEEWHPSVETEAEVEFLCVQKERQEKEDRKLQTRVHMSDLLCH